MSLILYAYIRIDDVVYYYYLSDITVDPVHDDDAAKGRCPLKLFEAWACSTPIITSDVGDRKILLGYPPAGVLCKAGDAKALANAMISLLNDAQKANNSAKEGMKKISTYNWLYLAEKMQKTYLQTNYS